MGRRGRHGRRWQVAAGLIYGQVKKSYRDRRLVRVTHVMRLGTEAALTATLQGLGLSGKLNTAFIERVNLTVRHGLAALARRTWATAQQSPHLLAHLEWWRASYHGCRVPTKHSESRSCSRENEGATVWHNGIGNGRRRWRRGERTGGGQHARCSCAPCRWFPLERGPSHRGMLSHVAGRWVKVPAEARGWRLPRGSEGLSGLPNHQKSARNGFTEDWSIYPPSSIGAPPLQIRETRSSRI